jgi:hypothetical protein
MEQDWQPRRFDVAKAREEEQRVAQIVLKKNGRQLEKLPPDCGV